ncbi:unnamed protein product, partial [Mycena citricolor]
SAIMSLLKVPLLMLGSIAVHTTMTSPNPAAPTERQLKPSGLERIAPKWAPVLLKGVFWGLGIAECVTILAQHFPHLETISQALDPNNGAAHLTLTPTFLAGFISSIVGTSIRLHCYSRLQKHFTFELSTRPDQQLVTDGAYGLVRHPSYLGALFSGIGAALCVFVPGSWLVACSGLVRPGEAWEPKISAIWAVALTLAAVGLGSRIRKEDRMMKERFGKEWEDWVGRVPYRLVPFRALYTPRGRSSGHEDRSELHL